MAAEPVDPGAPRILDQAPGLFALYKPAGMHTFGPTSLAAWLLSEHPELGAVGPAGEPALVHRLDRGTSGLILAARAAEAYSALRAAFSEKRIEKTYLALVEGILTDPAVVELGLGARYRRSKRVWPDLGAKQLRGVRPARSEIEPLGSHGDLTLCRVRMRTGVRHQIRAHLAHLGHPLAGDPAYGSRTASQLNDDGFFLHAAGLRLPSGILGPGARWICPLPADRLAWLDQVELTEFVPADASMA